jgi:hypothetical protein
MSTSPAPSRPRADLPLVRRDPVRRDDLVPRTELDGADGPDGPDPADDPNPDAAGAASPQLLQYPSAKSVPPQLVHFIAPP